MVDQFYDLIGLFFRLCKLLTSPILEVKELAADFLFVLCKENGTCLVYYNFLVVCILQY